MPNVFLSHATQNDEIVTRLHDAVENEITDFDVWVDHKDIKGNWQQAIERALYDCQMMIVALSHASATSIEVMAEWRRALSLNRPVLPVIIEDFPLEQVPSRLALEQYFFMRNEKEWKENLPKLIGVLQGDEEANQRVSFVSYSMIGKTIDERLTSIPITGRDSELSKVHEHINNAVTQIIAVGGTGKSRLAVEIIMTLKGINGALWHVCSDISKSSEVLYNLREYYGMDESNSDEEVFTKLKQMPRLIVIDNAESITDDIRRKNYIELIRNCRASGAPVLMTSRVAWREFVPSREIILKPLTDTTKIVLDMADNYFNILDAVKPFAKDIASACYHHPRLIEWAVSNLRHKSIDLVLRQLNDLNGRKVQEQLDEMIRTTYNEMRHHTDDGDLAHKTMEYLVVCPNFNYTTAKSLTHFTDEDDLNDALDTLVKWNFLRLSDNKARYLIDPMVQANLTAHEMAHQNHLEYFQTLANEHDKTQNFAGLDDELENLEVAFAWALTQNAETAYWIARAMSGYLRNRGLIIQYLEQIKAVKQLLAKSENTNDELKALLNNSFGTIYQRLAQISNRRHHIELAIAEYEEALTYHTFDTSPMDYARIQNNLGITYQDLSNLHDREANLQRAIQAYKNALISRTPESAPLAYAMTQNNLGSAYRNLSDIHDPETYLQKAIEAYDQALIYRTPNTVPLYYATTQNNLGNVYTKLSTINDRESNLQSAIQAYKNALIYRTPESAPLAYAMTQNNLGNAYRNISEIRNSEVNLERAFQAYEEALIYWTPESAPLSYALVQSNKGVVYERLSLFSDARSCWQEAEKYYRLMGDIQNANLMLKMIEGLTHTHNSGCLPRLFKQR